MCFAKNKWKQKFLNESFKSFNLICHKKKQQREVVYLKLKEKNIKTKDKCIKIIKYYAEYKQQKEENDA